MTKVRTWLLFVLIIFLPLSAWLVSYTGNYLVSLGRDILLAFFILFSLLDRANWRRPGALFYLAVIIGLASLVSYFFRQDMTAEWLRGVRYFVEPLVLLAALDCAPLPAESTTLLSRALLVSLTIVLLGAAIDYFHPAWIHSSLIPGSRGFLGQIHLAANLPRLQSTLAGPNALGLYLLVALLLTPLWAKTLPRSLSAAVIVVALVALVLTFSRSSYLGLLAGAIFLFGLGKRLIPRSGLWLWLIAAIGLATIATVAIAKPDYLTRAISNNTRLEQYHRVWNQRHDIGFWGRGAGTVGPFSDTSFDNRPTYFSENTYLDIYENIGVIGALAYVAFWIGLITTLVRQRQLASLTAAAAAFGLAMAGIFIDHYTGQAAIWTAVLFGALLIRPAPLSDERSPGTITVQNQ